MQDEGYTGRLQCQRKPDLQSWAASPERGSSSEEDEALVNIHNSKHHCSIQPEKREHFPGQNLAIRQSYDVEHRRVSDSVFLKSVFQQSFCLHNEEVGMFKLQRVVRQMKAMSMK